MRFLARPRPYSDDVNLENQAWCVMVRSQVAHGIIKGIDTEEARQMPGVLGIWTGTDLNAHRGTQTVTEGTDAIVALATEPAEAGTGRFIDRFGPVPW